MSLAVWAERNGVARVTAYRLVSGRAVAGTGAEGGAVILVDDSSRSAEPRSRTAVYARVSSGDQKADLNRQVARVTAWSRPSRSRSTRS
jgi:predicted site-specific integrase-resolvase